MGDSQSCDSQLHFNDDLTEEEIGVMESQLKEKTSANAVVKDVLAVLGYQTLVSSKYFLSLQLVPNSIANS